MNWKDLFSYKPGTPDFISPVCNILMLEGGVIAVMAVIMHLFFHFDNISSEVTLAGILLGAGGLGHGGNSFINAYGSKSGPSITPPIPEDHNIRKVVE